MGFFVLGLAVMYGLIILVLYTQQRRLIFHPPSIYVSPQGVGLNAQDIEIFLDKHGTATAWWIAPQDDKAVIVFFHGNASSVYSNYDIFRDLSDLGYGVLSVGYPGYPGSSGSPSQTSLVMSAQKHIEFLAKAKIQPDQIVYFGTSLGTGVAAQLAKTHPPSLLILDAPFNSMSDMVGMTVKLPGLKMFVKDPFRSDLALKAKTFPVLILHGTADRIIPVGQSKKLFESLTQPKSRHVIAGAGHTNLWGLGGREIILNALETR
mgnify:CR=1 FL=1